MDESPGRFHHHGRGGGPEGGRYYNSNNGRGRFGGGQRGGNRWHGGRNRGRGRGRVGPGRFHGGGGGGGGRDPSQQRSHDTSLDKIEELGSPSDSTISIAIEGCCHGELDRIYDRIAKHEADKGQKIDLLLCCGDFQSLRNTADFHSLAVPPKYRSLGTFYQYYSGVKVAPVLTIFIGGNHEASQPLQELYYGGWVAPNIYYMGAAGVINYNGIRIGGISGIYKSHDFNMGRYEIPPYDRSTLRSVYHVRNIDVYRLRCLSQESSRRIDVMLSHDWPQGIEQHGDTAGLLRKKPFFRKEVQENDLGSPANHQILETLRPHHWFSAHLHVKFKAVVEHGKKDKFAKNVERTNQLIPSQVVGSSTKDTDKPDDAEEQKRKSDSETTEFHSLETSSVPCEGPDLTAQMTQFLSLDKCLPRREYLSILHLPVTKRVDGAKLEYDPEWLAILCRTHGIESTERKRVSVPKEVKNVASEEIQDVCNKFGGQLEIPNNFQQTVPAHATAPWPLPNPLPPPLPLTGNPQTDDLLRKLNINHTVTTPWTGTTAFSPQQSLQTGVDNDNEIEIGEEDNDIEKDKSAVDQLEPRQAGVDDDNEIEIDDDIELGEGIVDSSHTLEHDTKINADEPNKKPRLNNE